MTGLPRTHVIIQEVGNMNKAERAGAELRAMDELAAQDSAVHRMPPLCKFNP